MENTSQRSGRSAGQRNRPRNRNRRRGTRNRRSQPSLPKKKQNPILAFFSNLLGGTGRKSAKTNKSQRSGKPSQNRQKDSSQREEKQPEVSSPRLYVGNLSYDTTESDLFDHFATVGQVRNAEVVRDRNDRSKGFGFVEMNSVETAKTASEKFHRTEYMGRQIIVSGAKK